MKNAVTITLLILILIAISAMAYQKQVKQTEPLIQTEQEQNEYQDMPLPPDPGISSAPEGALTSCLDKEIGDMCEFTIDENSIEGQCYDIMDELVCGPKIPDSETEPLPQ